MVAVPLFKRARVFWNNGWKRRKNVYYQSVIVFIQFYNKGEGKCINKAGKWNTRYLQRLAIGSSSARSILFLRCISIFFDDFLFTDERILRGEEIITNLEPGDLEKIFLSSRSTRKTAKKNPENPNEWKSDRGGQRTQPLVFSIGTQHFVNDLLPLLLSLNYLNSYTRWAANFSNYSFLLSQDNTSFFSECTLQLDLIHVLRGGMKTLWALSMCCLSFPFWVYLAGHR